MVSSILIIGAIAVSGIVFTPETGAAKCDNTYVYVTQPDGSKWVFVYDCDGRVVDIYPDI